MYVYSADLYICITYVYLIASMCACSRIYKVEALGPAHLVIMGVCFNYVYVLTVIYKLYVHK